MHIPDGMLDTKTWISAWIGSAGTLAYAVRRVRAALTDSATVLMAVLAALVFALQMLNFPVAGGTSGHFAGGAAVAMILGPWPAVIVMTAVLAVQALLLADGGITALGANVLTMGLVAPLVGWITYRIAGGREPSGVRRRAAAFAGAWAAVEASALVAALLLWVSGRVPLLPALGAMGFWHALIGLGEGAITMGLISYLGRVRPDLIASGSITTERMRPVAVALGAAALVAAGLSFVASASPDGLETVYGHLGEVIDATPLVGGLLSGYAFPGVSNGTLAGVLAGVVGVIVTGALAAAALAALRRRRTDSPDTGETE